MPCRTKTHDEEERLTSLATAKRRDAPESPSRKEHCGIETNTWGAVGEGCRWQGLPSRSTRGHFLENDSAIRHEHHSLGLCDMGDTGETPRWHILITNMVPKLPSGQGGFPGMTEPQEFADSDPGKGAHAFA